MLLHLVRHGRPLIEPGRPASTWPLDRSATDDMARLRAFVDDQVQPASWISSDEPKALGTAQALTDGPITTDPALREVLRDDWFATQEEFNAAVVDAFTSPDRPARPGWEPLDRTRHRVSRAARRIIGGCRTDVVLVGHGTAWSLLVSELTGRPPDLESWRRLGAPDLCTLDPRTRSIVRGWGDWA